MLDLRGFPKYVRSDNDGKLLANSVQDRTAAVGATAIHGAHGSQWRHRFIGSFNDRLPDELLDSKLFYSPPEADFTIQSWRL
jgi:hypothetical protein